MERLTERCALEKWTSRETVEPEKFVMVRGKALGRAYFESDQDYKNYCDAMEKLAAYEDTGLTPEEVAAAMKDGTYAQFQEWNRAHYEGRLVVLPCKVGDTVWGVVYDTRDCPNCVGIGGCFGCSKANPINVYRTDFKLHMVGKIGRTLFLTRAEAETAMKGVSEDA